MPQKIRNPATAVCPLPPGGRRYSAATGAGIGDLAAGEQRLGGLALARERDVDLDLEDRVAAPETDDPRFNAPGGGGDRHDTDPDQLGGLDEQRAAEVLLGSGDGMLARRPELGSSAARDRSGASSSSVVCLLPPGTPGPNTPPLDTAANTPLPVVALGRVSSTMKACPGRIGARSSEEASRTERSCEGGSPTAC